MKKILLWWCFASSLAGADWLVEAPKQRAAVERSADGRQVTMTNGLIRRVWRLAPDAATVGFDNLMTGASLIRSVKPEAELTIDGKAYEAGGLAGQEEWAYLRTEWLDRINVMIVELHDRIVPECARVLYDALRGRRFRQEIVGGNLAIDLR